MPLAPPFGFVSSRKNGKWAVLLFLPGAHLHFLAKLAVFGVGSAAPRTKSVAIVSRPAHAGPGPSKGRQ